MEKLTRRQYLGLAASTAAIGGAGCSSAGSKGNVAQQETATTNTSATETTQAPGPNASAGGNESVYTRLYRRTIGSVVLVRVGPLRRGRGGGQGTGFVYDRQHIVTNAHVVSDAERLGLQFSRGGSRSGQVVGRDRYADLAVIRVANLPGYADPLALVDSEPAVGTFAAAIGAPFGFNGTLTHGIVSAVDRSIPSPQGRFNIPNAIQTDVPVNPGNSGGPLVNLEGVVLGVINSGGGENIAFAISAPYVRKVVSALIEDGEFRHPFLGVGLRQVTQRIARRRNLNNARGLLVSSLAQNSPAAGALQEGDVIVGIESKPTPTFQALSSYLELNTQPGDTITLTVRRNGNRQRVEVTLGTRPVPGARSAPRSRSNRFNEA